MSQIKTALEEDAGNGPSSGPAASARLNRTEVGDWIEAALLQFAEVSSDTFLLIDRHWRIVYANQAARQIGPIHPENLNRETLWELYPEITGTEVELALRNGLESAEEQRVVAFYSSRFCTWSNVRILPVQGGLVVRFRDITAIHHAEESRAAAALQLQRVLEATTDAVIYLDRDWRITYMNRRAKEILAPTKNILGNSFWETFPQANYPGSPYVENYTRAMNDGQVAEFEAYYPEPLNIWFQIMAHPADDGIIIFFRDVTDQRQHEEALRASETRYRVLTELNPQALWTADAQGRVLYANQRFLTYIGKAFTPHDGTEYLECFYEADRERVTQVWLHSIQTGEEYTIEARLLRASDGAARWWRIAALPLRDASGTIEQWLGVANDIHESRLAAERLREQYAEIDRQRRELEAVYRGSPIGLALYEPSEFRLMRINNRQAEIFGLSPEKAIGRTVQELAPNITRSHEMIRAAAMGRPMLNQHVEGVLPTRPHDYRYWNVNYTPISGEDGSVHAIAGATIEITNQRRAEAALIQSEKLAAVGRLASSIAHEINNPLESVMNLLYLARQQENSSETQKLLETADQELRRVSIIANQTLRFHKQASRPQEITCADLFSTVLSIYEGRIKNCGVAVMKRRRAEKSILCFEGEIRQVLSNLIGNAIDAMPGGGKLFVRSREGTHWRSGRPGVVVTVADNGSGIDPQTKDRIFEAFFTTKGHSGTGLGLWISAEIIERHQGSIRIRSSQRKGSSGTVVTLFLPFQTFPASKEHSVSLQ